MIREFHLIDFSYIVIEDMLPRHQKNWATIFIAIIWTIWLARNRKVFDNVNLPERRMEENLWDTINLWANQCRKIEDKRAVKEWVQSNRPV
jgi:hypothetical protein